jgi:hypothetical protein
LKQPTCRLVEISVSLEAGTKHVVAIERDSTPLPSPPREGEGAGNGIFSMMAFERVGIPAANMMRGENFPHGTPGRAGS